MKSIHTKKGENTFIHFLRDNWKMVLGLAVFTILFSLQKIMVYNIGYDTDEFLINPDGTLQHWLSIDRFSLVFLKEVFPFLRGDLYLLNVLTYVHFFLFAVVFVYFLNMGAAGNNWKKNLICGGLIISSPVLLEQFYFTLQSAEFSLALFVMAVCFVLTYHLLETGKIINILFLVPLLVFCYGMYQAFLNLYIAGVLICMYKLNREERSQNIRRIVLMAGVWLVSAVIYFSVSAVVKVQLQVPQSEYLADKVAWISEPFGGALFWLAVSVGRVVLGIGHVLNLSYLISFLFLLYYFVNSKRKVSWKTFYMICLLASPFLINVVTGSRLLIRSMIVLPVFCAFVFFEFYSLFRRSKYIIWAVLVSQILNSQILLCADNIRFKNDVEIAQDIYRQCDANEETVIVFTGIERTEENVFSFKGQVMGKSFFEWSNDKRNVDETRILYFMQCMDMPLAAPTQEQVEYAGNISFGGEYPDDGYIMEHQGCIYVNLGE